MWATLFGFTAVIAVALSFAAIAVELSAWRQISALSA